MSENDNQKIFPKDARFLLALHSSTNTFGIGLVQIDKSEVIFKSSTIEVNQDLSNYLFNFIEETLPSIFWPQIKRLAVATGPGGYTSTRISVIFARTLAQQLQCDLDGISSFYLKAHRLPMKFINKNQEQTFWITEELKRRGTIAGEYKLINNIGLSDGFKIEELQIPHLIPINKKVSPAFKISEDVENDINKLLRISLNLYEEKKQAKWQNVLPIYPTSPIKMKK